MSLRVAHIIAGLGVGGAERHLVNLLNAMDCEYRAAIFLDEKTTAPSFHGKLDSSVEQHFVRIRKRSMPVGIFRLAKLLKEKRIDVIHTHMFDANLYGSVAARLAGVPVVVTSEHGENPWKKFYHRWLERYLISPAAATRFCVSQQILERRRDSDGVPAEKLQLTVNGTVLPLISEAGADNAMPVIGAVGRFITAKDFPNLFAAIAELRDQGYQFRLDLLGDGPERASLERSIADLQIGDMVNMPGMVTDVDHWYQGFDVYVSSSEREGQPVALLEAMAHGLPIVATDVGASADTVRHEQGGLIVAPRNSSALASALARMLDDAELRRSCGAFSRKRVEECFSVAAVAGFHLSAYRNALDGKHAVSVK